METIVQPCDGRDDDEDDADRRHYASVCSTIYIPTPTRTVPDTSIPLSIVTTSPISSSSSSCLNQPSQKYAATSPYYDILLYSPKRHALFMAQPPDTDHNTTTRTRTEILRNQLLQQPSGATTICDNNDTCSDGDQSPITDRTAHSFYMELFRTGS
jgi:hypothetical protein